MEIEHDAIICAARHFIAAYESAVNESPVDFGCVCTTCELAQNCRGEWLKTAAPVFEAAHLHPNLFTDGDKEATGQEGLVGPDCSVCRFGRKMLRDINVLQLQKEAVFAITDLLLIITELWNCKTQKVSLSGGLKKSLYKKLSEREEQIRTLFHDFIEAGEFSFLYGLIRALHDPKLFQ